MTSDVIKDHTRSSKNFKIIFFNPTLRCYGHSLSFGILTPIEAFKNERDPYRWLFQKLKGLFYFPQNNFE